MIIPSMGTTTRAGARTGIADALFSPVQQRVLGLLFGQPERRFQSAEIIRLAGSGTGAVHRLLTRLAASGLVTVTTQGNQKHYQAKTVGFVDPIRRALRSKVKRIHAAFIYGSVAKGTASASSDVDLLVISDSLRYPDIIEALQPAEVALGRTINPTVLRQEEWRSKRSQPGTFAARVTQGPKLLVIGSDDGIG
jgi:predicted nucleotidyltransferase